MGTAVKIISAAFIPGIIVFILAVALIKKQDVYTNFIAGAKEGLDTAVEILPYITAIFIAIDIFKNSGALDFLQSCITPVFNLLNIPVELFPMIVMKPVSGSGSLAILEKMIEECGPDSYAARAGSVMLGSSETLFYTIAVYFGATSVKKGRHTLIAGMVSYLAGTAAALLICRFM